MLCHSGQNTSLVFQQSSFNMHGIFEEYYLLGWYQWWGSAPPFHILHFHCPCNNPESVCLSLKPLLRLFWTLLGHTGRASIENETDFSSNDGNFYLPYRQTHMEMKIIAHLYCSMFYLLLNTGFVSFSDLIDHWLQHCLNNNPETLLWRCYLFTSFP